MLTSYPGEPRPGFFDSEENTEDESSNTKENDKGARDQSNGSKNINTWLNLVTFFVIGWIILKIASKGKHLFTKQTLEYKVSISSLLFSIFPRESRLISCVYHTVARR